MPVTRIQKLMFGMMMAAAMVYGLETYNAVLRTGTFSKSVFLIPLQEFILLTIVVVLVEKILGGPIARRLTVRFTDPEIDSPIKAILFRSFFTVCCMCPPMSLVAAVVFKGVDGDIALKWLETFSFNFPMALCWQVLIAGPAVRFAYKKTAAIAFSREG
jgi:hypothetical protein